MNSLQTNRFARFSGKAASRWVFVGMAGVMMPAVSFGAVFPAGGTDIIPTRGAMSMNVPGLGNGTVEMTGTSTVQRQNPCVGCGPGGRTKIETEIIAMSLTGNSSTLGAIVLNESPTKVSSGQVTEQSPGVNFPADSFFDIFFEIQTSQGLLHNDDSVRVGAIINSLPHHNGETHSAGPINLTLLNAASQAVGTLNSLTLWLPPQVPEPSSLALIGLATPLVLMRRRSERSRVS